MARRTGRVAPATRQGVPVLLCGGWPTTAVDLYWHTPVRVAVSGAGCRWRWRARPRRVHRPARRRCARLGRRDRSQGRRSGWCRARSPVRGAGTWSWNARHPDFLTRFAAVAAVGAGLIFIGVQVGHPQLDAETITTTEMAIRSSFKARMALWRSSASPGFTCAKWRRPACLAGSVTGVLGWVGDRLFALATSSCWDSSPRACAPGHRGHEPRLRQRRHRRGPRYSGR
jgi:hypothetical protein